MNGRIWHEGPKVYQSVLADPRWQVWVATNYLSREEAEAVATLLRAAPELRRLLAALIARNRTPDQHAEPEIVEARALLMSLE